MLWHVSIHANDFLLTFHSNHEPISYRFQEKRRFHSKITKFTQPVDFLPPLNEFWHCGQRTSDRATGPNNKKFDDIFSRVDTNFCFCCFVALLYFILYSAIVICCLYTNVTEKQTDGHRTTAKTALTHSVAWHMITLAPWMSVAVISYKSSPPHYRLSCRIWLICLTRYISLPRSS